MTSTALPDLTVVPALNHATLSELRDLVRSPGIDVVSTDVFDTLMWRRVQDPVAAFALVGERLRARGALASSLNPGAFAQLRRTAEQRVRKAWLEERATTEIRLAEIYDGIPPWVFGGAGRESGIQAELETERELLIPDLDVVDVLSEAAEAGKTLIAVSDTYFSADQLRQLIGQDASGRLPFRMLFSSSDHRDNKSGKLFDIALAALGVAPGRVAHIGDNEGADINPPKSRGIRTVMLERRSDKLAGLLAQESRFRGPASALAARDLSLHGTDFGLAALRSKMEHRSELADAPSGLQPFWRFGAQVYGPVFAGFAEWVHEQARAAGASRVWCLMREGAFLTDLVRAGGGGAAEPVEAAPLWINRDICSRAAIGSGTREELEIFLQRRTSPTVAEMCRLLGVSIADIPALTAHAETRMEDAIIRELVLEELTSGPVRERIVTEARALRDRLVRYLHKVAPDDDPLVLCDLGWGATIQQRLDSALVQAGSGRRIVGLYLVTHEGATASVSPNSEVRGFLANFGEPAAVVSIVLRSPEILEQSCMPAHGGQTDIDGDLEPVIGDPLPASSQQAEAEALRRGVLAFQREYLRYQLRVPAKVIPLSRAADLVAPILMRSLASPTADEAAMFGRWMHDEGSGSDKTDSLVTGEWLGKLKHLAPEQLPKLPMQDVYWPWGLARQADPDLAELASAVAAGLLTNDSTTGELESGAMTIEAIEGVGIEGSPRYHAVPRRNRDGLSFVTHTMKAGSISRFQIRLGQEPAVMRIDWLEFKLWIQGERDPVKLRLDPGEGFDQLDRTNVLLLAPNLFVSTAPEALLSFNPASVTDRVVHRVDVELAFASIASSVLLPGPGTPQALVAAEETLRAMQGSLSWRITAPLRRVKRLLR